jgi:regulator of RNase E activity RraA
MEDLISKFKTLDTTCVSDALDRIGIACGMLGIKPLVPGKSICGRAFTVHYAPCGVSKGTVGDFLDDVKPGEAIVIDNSGREHCTVWGDIMTVVANKNGVAGTVIDGVCRDVPEIRKTGYPVFSKGYFMVTGKDRVEANGINVPVSISGVRVKPGDIIMADDSGAIVIPREVEEKTFEFALQIAESERMILEEIGKGVSLRESRRKMKYHSLQTKVK